MDDQQFDALIRELAAAHTDQRDGQLDQRRGDKTRTVGGPTTGHPPTLTLGDRPLATMPHQRMGPKQVAVAVLLDVRPETITRRIQDTRQILTTTAPCHHTRRPTVRKPGRPLHLHRHHGGHPSRRDQDGESVTDKPQRPGLGFGSRGCCCGVDPSRFRRGLGSDSLVRAWPFGHAARSTVVDGVRDMDVVRVTGWVPHHGGE